MVIKASSAKHRQRANRYSRADDRQRRQENLHPNFEDRVDDFFGGFIMRMQDWLDAEKRRRSYGRRRKASRWHRNDGSQTYNRFEQASDPADHSEFSQDDGLVDAETVEVLKRRGKQRYSKRGSASGSRRKSRGLRRRPGHLYRDRSQKKIAGICAGIAGYLDKEVWKVRVVALIGLFLIPTVTFTSYWILYFILDDKPFYKQVIDAYPDPSVSVRGESSREENAADTNKPLNHTHTLRRVKQLFSANEERLRTIEAFVTSPRFELNRAFQEMDTKE
ncbi:MAG: PspC domain-containing protein [Gammaproteobacteria bacterium]|jgi:phage shock protein C|nr:PspC domain-containing protein [Gammaproteobacteria bacterium]MBT5204364.1 PspC domain-containing protein [Gammaproteobacteria bacterium]MBT5602275.1 PspC domain-containing protein [Gammaproteobacteria bacterium]MBT6245822.1 PspC domain-containing protein [Gammaproteobacteria bacterium]